MDYKKKLLSTVLSGILFVSLTSHSSTSYSATDISLSPVGDWQFSKETKGNEKIGPYCMMAQKFDQNIFLVFAENTKGERSVAVDFQSARLDPSKTYTVSLDPGSKETRTYEVKPVSEKVFIVRFGEDHAFVQAMKETKTLSVEFAGELYSFTLNKTGEGWLEMSKCVADLIHPVSEQPVFAAVASPPENLLEPVQTITVSGNKAADATVAAASTASKNVSSVVESIAHIPTPPKAPRVEKLVAADTHKIKQEVASLKAENNNLKAELTRMAKIQSTVSESMADKDALSVALQQSKTENSALQKELDATLAQIEALKKQVSQAAQNDKASQDNENKILESELAYLKKENERLIKELEVQKIGVTPDLVPQEKEELLTKIRAFEGDLKIAQKENESLKTELNRLQTAAEKGQLALLPKDWNMEQATKRYHEAQREVRRLGASLEREKQLCMQEKKEIEYMLFDPELASGAQISLINSMEEELKQSEVQKKKLEAELANAKMEILSFKSANKGNRQEVGSIKEELALLQKEKADLKGQLLKAQAEIGVLKNKLTDPSKDLRISMLEEEKARLKTELDSYVSSLPKKEKNIAGLEAEVTRLKGELNNYKVQVSEKDNSLKALQNKNMSIQAQLDKNLTSSSDHESTVRTLEQKNKRLQEELDKFFAEAPIKESKISSMQQELARLKAELDTQSSELPAKEVKIKALRQENARLQAELNEQMTVGPAKDVKIKTLEQELSRLQVELNQQIVSFAGKEAKIKALEEDLASTQARLHEDGKAQRVAVTLKAKYKQLVDKYKALAKERDSYKAKLANVSQNAISTNARFAETSYSNTAPSAGNDNDVNGLPPVSAVSHTTKAQYMNEQDIASLMNRASISLSGAINTVSGQSGNTSYRWQTGHLYGSAEMKEISGMSGFDPSISQYIDKTKRRCQGDFAAVPGKEYTTMGGKIKSYEIACVAGQVQSSAALVFYGRGNTFTTFAHEGSALYMQDAMNIRDRLIDALK